jgi:uncharacterized membrane protein YedE/YeeE
MEHFTPVASTIGGVMIGLASAMLLLFNGKIAGVSGVAGNLLAPSRGDIAWRVAFVAGLVLGGVALYVAMPGSFGVEVTRSLPVVALAGLLVGFGSRLGSGCTSGHGVCGLSRLSPRSLVSVVTFMATGAIVVFLTRTIFGGAL